MNTTTHAVEVPFPQALRGRTHLFPSAPRYSMEPWLARLIGDVVRSNQTARCDECASIQTRIEFSRCYLAPCERAISAWLIPSISQVSRLSLNNQRRSIHAMQALLCSRGRRAFHPYA